MHTLRRLFPVMLGFVLLLSACSPSGNGGNGTPTPFNSILTPAISPASKSPTPTQDDTCPTPLSSVPGCFTPHQLRVAYGVESLIEHGFTGKGQTVVDIVSFGSPTLQQDMDVFDQQFGLPPITIKVISPIGTKPFDPNDKDMAGWAGENEMDVQIIHSIAPDAGVVVLTSPVSETEGVIGLPEFLQLEQYAINNHLGNIVSQ